MTATDLTLSSDVRVGSQYVYVKQLWADEWELIQGLQCAAATWNTFPAIGQATIERPYGLGMFPGDSFASYKSSLEIKNWLVKIEYYSVDGAVGPLIWYGVAGIEEKHRHDRVNDNGTMKVSGQQVWHCYELGYWLDRFPIVTGWFDKDGVATEIGGAPAFNARGVANRSKDRDLFCFYFAQLSGEDNADFWSSRDIIEYLLAKFQPQLGIETGPTFNITVENPEDLPDWDKPEISVHGKTLWEAVSQVLDRRRGLGGYFYVSGSDLVLKVYTITDEPIALNGEEGETLAANATQYNLIVDHRPDLGTALKLSSADQYDRVILQGRKRRSVLTLDPSSSASEFVGDWTEAEKDRFNDGASNQTDYGTVDDDTDQVRNHKVRNSPSLIHVFSRFRIRSDWDGMTTCGVSADIEDLHPAFPDDEDETKVFGNWPDGWRILPSMPLYVGVDYSDDHIENGDIPDLIDAETPFMPIEVYIPGIGSEPPFFTGAAGGVVLSTSNDEQRMSIRARAEDDLPRFWLDVNGSSQQVIATAEFVPLAEDITYSDAYDWTDFLVTLCMEENRRVTVKYPEELGGAGADIPAIREKLVDVGDGFCLDWVVPNTVVGIKEDGDGALLRSNGGFVRDDRPKMRAMATQLYVFYSAVRKVLRIEKTGLTDELWLGDYVTQLGSSTDSSDLAEAVGTVVTQISVSFPQGQNGSMPGPPTQQWETAQGEIDRLIVPVRRRRR